ncbi:Ribonuclease Z, mitochondrial [Armadillidium nasatum]|uniref:ribonuclease Z n=1 Tax=Armadillidium nasatum TaxID=96803 RepID=A0A5N5T1A9_9CRUS|nr:Ribonuclease Z, mitochondrial [Armadillidium nasatum]
MKRLNRGLSRREKYKNKICGIVESNFRFANVFLQVVGSGAYGAPQSLIVQSHYHRFLFNCGEGMRRIALDNKIECDYFTRLFLTSCSWDNVSGLPGFVIRENKVEEIMPVIRRICGPSVSEISPSKESSKYVLAYICTFPLERGILSTTKLVSADVPPGPLVDDLRNGLTVTLPDGRIVTPLDVSIHNYNSSSFIVLEIPSVEYLESLISSSDFDKYKKEGTCNHPEENDLKIIVHFSPHEVMKDSRYRRPKSLIMLDCGKGTLNQLVRLMGKDETRSTLRHLKLIFISHIHQDHHMGLSAILTERRKAFLEADIKSPPPLYILLPPDVFPVLQNFRHCFDLDIQNVVFIDNIKLTGNYNKNFYKYRNLTEFLELERVTTAFVHHVRNSFGIALKHIDGWKIVYSGDCRPSKNLVDIGENCDLLIHEATFEDELFKEAEINGHSTVSQAVKMGINMNAKFTILTHFSQRYQTLPLLDERVIKENVGIAFDNMKVTFQDLPYLRHMYPTLKEIFYEDFQQSDAQRLRRSF